MLTNILATLNSLPIPLAQTNPEPFHFASGQLYHQEMHKIRSKVKHLFTTPLKLHVLYHAASNTYTSITKKGYTFIIRQIHTLRCLDLINNITCRRWEVWMAIGVNALLNSIVYYFT